MENQPPQSTPQPQEQSPPNSNQPTVIQPHIEQPANTPQQTKPVGSLSQTAPANPAPSVPDTLYPNSPSETPSLTGLTGSQLESQEKNRLPVGVYIIVGLLFLAFIGGLFSTSANFVNILSLLIDALLGIGLLSRKSIARKIMVIFSIISIVVMILTIISLPILKNAADQKAQKAENALNQLQSKPNLTSSDTSRINYYKQQIANGQKTLKQADTIAYITLAIEIVGYVIIVIYLTRPKVKAAFN